MKNTVFYLALIAVVIVLGAMTSSVHLQHNSQSNQLKTMNDYPEEWKEIKALENKGLIKSALEKVTALCERAKVDKNDPQIIKTILFRERYGSQLEEYGFENSIRTFQKEVETLDGSAKAIMHFMIGKSLANYVQANQWKFSNRTTTPNFQQEDIETWSIQDFYDEIDRQFAQALSETGLKDEAIEAYDAITIKGQNSDHLRPTIFDVIAHQILDYYMSPNGYLTEPVYKFYLDQEEGFSPAKNFCEYTFVSQDSSARLLRATQIFQEVLQHQLNKKNSSALVDVDLKRLQFVYNNTALQDKGSRYIAALNALANEMKDDNLAMPSVLYAQAQFYQRSNSYLNQEKSDYKQAYTILEKLISDYPTSGEANEAKNMMSPLSAESLRINTEKVYPKGEQMLSLVTYKNIDKIYLRLYKIDPEEEYGMQNEKGGMLKAIEKRQLLKSWEQVLPIYKDFHQHSTEINIGSQDFGKYILVTSSDKSFNEGKGTVVTNFISVSNLSYILDPQDQSFHLIVVDRITGKPLPGVTVSLFKQFYNSSLRRNELREEVSTMSDENGFVNSSAIDNHRYIPKLVLGQDVLFLRDWTHKNKTRARKDQNRVNIFLDRAIYRPGQTIYFKAIAYAVDGETQLPALQSNQELKVVLKDANYQDVESLSLTTNEFGSIHGSFIAPMGGLLGNMTIQIEGYGGTNFSVEEYKRPKFEAEFLPVKDEYALNETVQVTAKATGFAGNAIGDAKVAYRVERGVEYPYWRSYYRWYRPQAPMRIKTGETVSKADGTIEIEFDLIPDPTTRQKNQPVFIYTIYADITDISGETQSIQTRIKASHLAMDLNLNATSPTERDSFKSFNIYTKNLNGKFQSAEVEVKIESLISEDRLYRERYWAFPDTVAMMEKAFSRDFPHYRYAKKKQALELPVATEVYNEKVTTTEKGEIILKDLSLEIGLYKITASTKDKNGNLLEKEIVVEIKDRREDKMATPVGLAIYKDKNAYEPEENANLDLKSAIANASVFFKILRRDNSHKHKWVNLNRSAKESISIFEADRGGLAVCGVTIHNNRIYISQEQITVPWSNKNLKLSYSSFRDLLLPGQEEEWTIKVEGNKKEILATELLAGMYDASLDQFRANNWQNNFYPNFYGNINISAGSNFRNSNGNAWSQKNVKYYDVQPKSYRQFDWLGFDVYGSDWLGGRVSGVMLEQSTSARAMKRGMKERLKSAPAPEMSEARDMADGLANNQSSFGVSIEEDLDMEPPRTAEPSAPPSADKGPAVRKNLNETVFFFPDLKTDKDGNVLIKFKMNEALTKWKFMTFAHTKSLATAISTKEIVTQKKLMVQPNAPRFFREGDRIRYSAKVSNLTDQPMTGIAKLSLFDAVTNEPLDKLYGNTDVSKEFIIQAGESAPLFWELEIPKDKLGTVLHRVMAEAGEFADGEESALPILTNRKLVTEIMPMPLRAGQSKEFVFETMRDNTSTTLTNHAFTLEFTSNPAWYAVQALPYLMEYPYKCTEQVFNKYYANALATHVANNTPKIKQIFESWKGTDAMKSNLSKNQELKSALLEETPWVLDAQSEEQQKRNIALLFDLNKMSNEKAQSLKTLTERQLGNGGFAWFPGGRDSWYITQYLVEGIGHLQTLGVDTKDQNLDQVLKKALAYIDDRLVEDYQRKLKYSKSPGLSGMVIHYLYARSFFLQMPLDNKTQKVVKHYQDKVDKNWVEQGLHYQGLLALATDRFDMNEVAGAITASLKERALSHEELGKYWKYERGYFWHQMPIETHAIMIEVFEQVAKDKAMVDELRLWLLKNKQTNAWKTTKATASAVFALLMSGDAWLQETKQVDIVFPNKMLNADMAMSQTSAEAGTGYFKHTWTAVNPNLSSLKVKNPNTVPAWGAAYWQYFEDLDKITGFEETPLKLNKKVFKESQGDRGATMAEVTEGSDISVGDKLVVRIELRVDRDMEFIHMKDMRASGFEPMNVLSQYKWQGGLGYYESTKDASTNFFFDQLPKGTYVFEYPLRVVHQGNFSNGVTTIQSMYAPEFASHSKGVRISVGE